MSGRESRGQRLELAAVDEQLEEVGRRLELDVLDARTRRPRRSRAEPRAAARARRAARRCRPSTTRSAGTGARKPMLDRVCDVDVGREAAGEVQPVDFAGIDAELAQQDPLADRVRGLRLGERGGVGARERDAGLGVRRRSCVRRRRTRPSGVMRPARRSSASRSIRPEPQSPTGGASPIVRSRERCRLPAVETTRSRPRRPACRRSPRRPRTPARPGSSRRGCGRVPASTTSVLVPTSTSISTPSRGRRARWRRGRRRRRRRRGWRSAARPRRAPSGAPARRARARAAVSAVVSRWPSSSSSSVIDLYGRSPIERDVEAEEEVAHRRVADDHDLVDLAPRSMPWRS